LARFLNLHISRGLRGRLPSLGEDLGLAQAKSAFWEVNFEPAFPSCGKPPLLFQFKTEFPKPLLLESHTKLGLYAFNDILYQEHQVQGIYRRRSEAVFGVKIGRPLVFGMHQHCANTDDTRSLQDLYQSLL